MDQVAKQSTVDRLTQANNVLVTVSASPSVDQLAAAIGLTLFLNKQGKHATAVFSGDVPSTLEFLQPEKTIEKNTDSLRDFIISLDKSKADKLRYKVEDNVVKIFITPYRTSISEKDFDFSQGDFNVDVVMALGVHSKEELDQAIVAHGRILHDATVISITDTNAGSLGTINWQDQQASSLCEMLVDLAETIKPDSFDAQMATAFLTGIVAQTQRFSNEKTTSRTMSLSAKLMAAGANQQLVATQLQSKSAISKTKSKNGDDDEGSNGVLEIDHSEKKSKNKPAEANETTLPEPQAPEANQAKADNSPIKDVREETGNDNTMGLFNKSAKTDDKPSDGPSRGGTLTANAKPEGLSPALDPLAPPAEQPLMQRGQHGSATAPANNNLGDKTLSNIEDAVIDQDKTLTDIEKTLGSPKAPGDDSTSNPLPGLDSARDAVAAAAVDSEDQLPQRSAASGASAPLMVNNTPNMPSANNNLAPPAMPAPNPAPAPNPVAPPPQPRPPQQSPIPPDPGLPSEQTGVNTPPTAPPPVPPPMTAAFPPQNPPANN